MRLQDVCLAAALWLPAGCYQGALAAEADDEGSGSDGSGAPEDEASSGDDEGGTTGDPVHRGLSGGARGPEIADPGDQVVAEDEDLEVVIDVRDPDGDEPRVWATGLPPGATWDEARRALQFRPDFVQGGQAWTVTITADDGGHRRTRSFAIEVIDSIAPPPPTVVESEEFADYTRLTLEQTTDDYLDSPGYAGRSFLAYVTVPHDATVEAPMPVRVTLHGFGSPPAQSGSYREFRVGPYDPSNTYWAGYDAGLPDAEATGEVVPDYTLRRTLHLLEWVLTTYPEADARRVFVAGSSMGGAGALTLGTLYARHFAYVSAVLAQAVPRNHRPSRIAQLSGLWGPTYAPVWDRLDVTRVLRDEPEAQDQYVYVRHGKDDPTIHFGAAVFPSPQTGESLYQALQSLGIGHLAVWDEGAHGPADPLLGGGWWDDEFSPIHDDTTFLRGDLAFPGFSHSSADGDPGDGGGNGKQAWSTNAGYAGDVDVPGDTGWNGEIAGTLNRFLRWDANRVVDTLDRFAIPLHVLDGEGADPPQAGYPSEGDRFDGELPVVVDVTPRRTQAFRARPGERVAWAFGAERGEVTADERGAVTIRGLALDLEWQTLELTRLP
jgi:hypothetical protein